MMSATYRSRIIKSPVLRAGGLLATTVERSPTRAIQDQLALIMQGKRFGNPWAIDVVGKSCEEGKRDAESIDFREASHLLVQDTSIWL